MLVLEIDPSQAEEWKDTVVTREHNAQENVLMDGWMDGWMAFVTPCVLFQPH